MRLHHDDKTFIPFCSTVKRAKLLGMLSSLGAILMIGISACGKAPEITQKDLVPRSLADISTWQPEILNTRLGEQVGTGGTVDGCAGYIDIVSEVGEPAETRVEGWAWNSMKSAAFPTILLADKDGMIVGAGETLVERADVKAAMPGQITYARVGFVAFTHAGPEGLSVYGLNKNDDKVCMIGNLTIHPQDRSATVSTSTK